MKSILTAMAQPLPLLQPLQARYLHAGNAIPTTPHHIPIFPAHSILAQVPFISIVPVHITPWLCHNHWISLPIQLTVWCSHSRLWRLQIVMVVCRWGWWQNQILWRRLCCWKISILLISPHWPLGPISTSFFLTTIPIRSIWLSYPLMKTPTMCMLMMLCWMKYLHVQSPDIFL